MAFEREWLHSLTLPTKASSGYAVNVTMPRGELLTFGQNVVNVSEFIGAMVAKLDGYAISALCCDRFRQAELIEALSKTTVRCLVVYRGQGFKDGAADVEKFRSHVFDLGVKVLPSLLLRSALSDSVVAMDIAGNAKLAKGRSLGRIDAAAAALLAIAEGSRVAGRLNKPRRAAIWV